MEEICLIGGYRWNGRLTDPQKYQDFLNGTNCLHGRKRANISIENGNSPVRKIEQGREWII